MADGLIDMIIQSADFDALNVKPGDVLKGKLYVGSDGMSHAGEMIDRGSPTLYLDLNSKISLPEGKYSGGSASQIIPTMGETRVTPGTKQVTVYTNGTYMTGNIIVNKLDNLKPENIKLGQYVGHVGPGTWQGFIVSDYNTFYYRGTYGPGHTISDYITNDLFNYQADRTNELKYLLYTPTNGANKGGGSTYSVFNAGIDLTYVNKLVIQYSIYKGDSSSSLIFNAYLTNEKNTRYQAINGLKIASSENKITSKDTSETMRTAEIDVSGLSRTAYLSIYVLMGLASYKVKIHSVKFI